MIFLVDSDTTRGVPYPELSTIGVDLPRSVFPMGGPPIAEYLPKDLVLSVQDGAQDASGLTDFICGVGWLVVSQKLKDVFDAQRADVEYIPVRLQYRGALHSGFFVANPRHRVRGVDLASSDIELNSVGVAREVNRLVLDEAKFEGVPIAVLHETAHLAVQASVAHAVDAAGCTGCAFFSPASVNF